MQSSALPCFNQFMFGRKLQREAETDSSNNNIESQKNMKLQKYRGRETEKIAYAPINAGMVFANRQGNKSFNKCMAAKPLLNSADSRPFTMFTCPIKCAKLFIRLWCRLCFHLISIITSHCTRGDHHLCARYSEMK